MLVKEKIINFLVGTGFDFWLLSDYFYFMKISFRNWKTSWGQNINFPFNLNFNFIQKIVRIF